MADMTFNFKGKKALVTGGSKGIGRDIVEALARAGIDKIYVLGRDQTALDELKSKLSCVETINVELTNWQQVREALENVEPVNFLINNAGINIGQSFYDVTEDAFDSVMSVNVKSMIVVSQMMCAKMRELDGGVVVNVSSQASMKALPGHLSYCSSKAAVDAMTRQMAYELAPKIRVNAVNPTVVLTELGRAAWDNEKGEWMKASIPLRRFAELEEVTKVVLFLLTDGAGMIHGHRMPICGGFTNV